MVRNHFGVDHDPVILPLSDPCIYSGYLEAFQGITRFFSPRDTSVLKLLVVHSLRQNSLITPGFQQK